MHKQKPKKKPDAEQLVAKAFAHPLRVQILTILNERVCSPNRLSQELGRSLNLVAYHVRVLEKYNCIELVETKQRRGATEHFYRATTRPLLSDNQWAGLPKQLRPGLSAAVLKAVFDDIDEAVAAETFDDDEVHLSRTPMALDRHGWDEIVALLNETLERVFSIQAKASERLAQSKEEELLSKVEIMHFRSPSQEVSGAAASGVATTKEKLSSR